MACVHRSSDTQGQGVGMPPVGKEQPPQRSPPAPKSGMLAEATQAPSSLPSTSSPPCLCPGGEEPPCVLPGNILSFAEIVKEVEVPQAARDTLAPGTGDSCHSPVAEEEEEVGIPIPAPGLLQVTERRREYGGAAWPAPRGAFDPQVWGAWA